MAAAISSTRSRNSAAGKHHVHQPDAERLRGVDQLAGQDQPHRLARTDHAREPLRAAAARDDPEVDLRLPQARGVRGDAQVAGQRQLAPAAEREAVDHRDHRLGARRRSLSKTRPSRHRARCSSGVRSANSAMSAPATKAGRRRR
jgi:hypothetical protein